MLLTRFAGAAAPDRLADIRSRGLLGCGIWPHVAGFAIQHGASYSGFDIDTCRAIAAAVLGDPAKIRFVPLATLEELTRREEVDVAIRRLTWTLPREQSLHVAFGPVTFYDGQGFLVPKASGIHEAFQLAGAAVCVLEAEHHPATLYKYFHDKGQTIQLVLVANDQAAHEALLQQRCRAYSADISWLAAARAGYADEYDILPDMISKEPLAPLVRARDQGLLEVVRWTIYSLIEAEELGVDSKNIHKLHPHEPLEAIIAGVGNYGEMYERNLGRQSAIKLERGPNRLWKQGGLLYAPPLER